ncbi:hypothetical protein [Brevundimonas sp.]|uniref:hypothetical protein n=1 Tax=Brevundimonas sp. TaxID=1871086 RepID=UPI002ABA619B|nr:hypothetical protein [Brevundimonas sp.]MDZ4363985.1 hypothetical protein [Brevundimonas sp.]
MNLTLPELLLAAFLIGLCLWRSRAALFFLWPISILIFPTARLVIGFPLYIYDVVAITIAASYWKEILGIRWSIAAIPWHYVFWTLILICGVLWPLVIYDFNLEIFWVYSHATIAFSSFAFGSLIFFKDELTEERKFLGYGIAVSALTIGTIGAIQFGSVEVSKAISDVFYRDLAEDSLFVSDYYAQIASERAAGPYGSANGLGIVGVMTALMIIVLVRHKPLVIACLIASAFAVLASVSRQAMIAAALATIAYFVFAQSRQKGGLLVILVVLGPMLVIAFLGSDFAASTLERFSRWETGIQEDDNFTARYIDGPLRLIEAVRAFPDIILFGTGPDIQKLYSAGSGMIGRAQGFLSIGYALFFFQYGILGLIAGVWMHIQAWAQLRFMPVDLRGKFAAILTAIVTFYVADNAPNISESIAMLCLLPIGMLAGQALKASQARALAVAGQQASRQVAPRPFVTRQSPG